MSKVIHFQPLEYHNKLSEVINHLKDMEEQVSCCMIDLATSGKWKQWSDEQAIGTEFEFTEEMLRDTGDKNVDVLAELVDKIIETKERLK